MRRRKAALVVPLLVGLMLLPAAPAWAGPAASAGKPAARAQPEPKFARVDFEVHGSSCVACIRRVVKKLQAARGVMLADISIFSPHPAVVVYDRARTSFQEIVQSVKDEPVRFEQVEEITLSTVPAVVVPKSLSTNATGRAHSQAQSVQLKEQ